MTYEPRIEELSRRECYRLLGWHASHVGRVALPGGRPEILPVNYALDGQDVVFRTAAGTRFGDALPGAQVAFEADEVHAAWQEGWSVLVRGRAELVGDEDERRRLRELALRPWAPGERDRFVRLRAEVVTGRRIMR